MTCSAKHSFKNFRRFKLLLSFFLVLNSSNSCELLFPSFDKCSTSMTDWTYDGTETRYYKNIRYIAHKLQNTQSFRLHRTF